MVNSSRRSSNDFSQTSQRRKQSSVLSQEGSALTGPERKFAQRIAKGVQYQSKALADSKKKQRPGQEQIKEYYQMKREHERKR